MITIRTLDDLSLPRGVRVFYRVDYNVPLDSARITDATRIEETLPTLRRLRDAGAAVVIASHLGRPKGERKTKYSLEPIRAKLAELLDSEVQWANDCVGDEAEAKASVLQPGHVLLLENLRFHAGEEANDRGFAEQLRKLADYYVNDAFGACHRAHASIDALPRLFEKTHTAGGLLLAKEIEFLQKITNVSDRPFVALLGGAKIAGKIEPLEALVKLADTVLVGGGMANTFLAARGVAMGGSLVDKDSIEVAKRITNVTLPVDLVVADDLEQPKTIETVAVENGLTAGQKAFDIGPKVRERSVRKGNDGHGSVGRRSRWDHSRWRRRIGRSGESIRIRRPHQPHLHRRRRIAGVHFGQNAARSGGLEIRKQKAEGRRMNLFDFCFLPSAFCL